MGIACEITGRAQNYGAALSDQQRPSIPPNWQHPSIPHSA